MPQYKFKIIGNIDNVSNVAGVGYELNVNGDSLADGTVGADGSFKIKVKSDQKKLKGDIDFEKLNAAGSANFTSNSLEYSLSSNESQRIKVKSKKSNFNYSFSLDNPVSPIAPPPPEANNLTLTTFEDVYSNAIGGQVIGGALTANNERFTAGQDIVTAAAGTLGQNDNLNDATTGDNDQLRVTTTANNTLQTAVAGVSTVVGVENLVVSATNDASTEADLSKFSGLSSVQADGSFTNRLELKNYLSSGATSFDFSGVTTGGVNISNANRGTDTASPLTLIGSRAEDILEANIGPATLRGGLGNDTIKGSQVNGVRVVGGQAADNIDLFANNAQDTVSLRSITTFGDRDNITNFAGAGNNATNFDLLEFDALTFSNYTAGGPVQEVTAAQAAQSAAVGAGQNMFVIDTFANIAGLNASGQGTSWLAYANDTGRLYYSANGDFSQERDQIAFLQGFANTNNLTAENIAIV